MKKLLYTLAIIVVGLTSNYAQTTPSTAKYVKVANAEVSKLESLLQPTDDQKSKLFDLELERQNRRGEMKELGENATEEQKISIKQWYKAYPARLKAILTPEQYKVLEKQKEKEKNALTNKE